MLRALVLATGIGITALAAAPASANVTVYCFSADTTCETFVCPDNETPLYRDGFSDTGPWLVICPPV